MQKNNKIVAGKSYWTKTGGIFSFDGEKVTLPSIQGIYAPGVAINPLETSRKNLRTFWNWLKDQEEKRWIAKSIAPLAGKMLMTRDGYAVLAFPKGGYPVYIPTGSENNFDLEKSVDRQPLKESREAAYQELLWAFITWKGDKVIIDMTETQDQQALGVCRSVRNDTKAVQPSSTRSRRPRVKKGVLVYRQFPNGDFFTEADLRTLPATPAAIAA